MWDVSDCAHYYYGMFKGMGGVIVPIVTVAKGHGGMGKRACMCVGGVDYYGLYVAR